VFTGIVEEIGTVEKVVPVDGSRNLRIGASKVLEDITPEDSISVAGVCLTVTKAEKRFFEVTAVLETLQRSILGKIKPGDRVNLERAVRLNGRLGGHFVQGHVDGVGKVVSTVIQGAGKLVEIEIPEPLSLYTVERGSIAVDGVSLTIARLKGNRFTVSLIPYTLEHTTLHSLRPGTEVNIEVDLMGKYVERFLQQPKHEGKMGEEWFRSMGY